MTKLSIRISLILLSIILLGSTFPLVRAEDPNRGDFVLIDSKSSGIKFEVQVPLDSLDLEIIQQAGQPYTYVRLPGAAATADPGAPQLPLMSQLIAVPFGVDFDLQVQPGKFRVVQLTEPVLPVPTQMMDGLAVGGSGTLVDEPQAQLIYTPEPEFYKSDELYPRILGEIVNEGIMRQQRVVSVALYPVQYNPIKSELTLYESFSVSLSFKGEIQTAKISYEPESQAYEALFRQKLLNYSSSQVWRLPANQQEAQQSDQKVLTGLNTLPWTPPDPAWRIKVRDEGVYRVTYDDLSTAGLDVDNLVPRTFQLFYQGQEVGIWVEGESDDVFNTSDSIIFFAEPLESKYTLDNVYWLTYGTENGLRMQSRAVEVPNNPPESYFSDQKHFEENNIYSTYPSGDDDYERFLWDSIVAIGGNVGNWTYTFPLTEPISDPDINCALELDLLGFSNLPQNHHVELYLNNNPIGETFWQGQTWAHLSASFASELLLPENTLRIALPNDQDAYLDWIYVERFSLTYPSGFRAQDNSIKFDFVLDGGNRFDLEGFGTDSLFLFEVNDLRSPEFLTGFQVLTEGLEFTLSFQEAVQETGSHTYLAVGSDALKSVHAIELAAPTDLGSSTIGVDYLIITHSDFLEPAQTLADFRQSQDLRTILVNVQDIYDQFGYGIAGKDPIQAFLSYAYQNWEAPAPSYVVLMGDGHYNPKGYNPGLYEVWRESFIPPYLAYVDPLLGETAADNRYADLVGDDTLPDMMLGRMAVVTVGQANAFVNKIIAYEENPSTIDWQMPVLAVADNADSGGNFPAISQFLLSSSLPKEYQAQRVYLGITHSNIPDAKAAIIDAINNGKFLVNYIGHAAERQWADGIGLLATSDVAALTNINKYPVISAMTCKEGYYINPQLGTEYEALAEVITRAEDKGAIASWSSTGNSVATGHDIINRELFVAIFSDLVPTIGQATQQSLLELWASGTYLDLIDTYLLFGDPATKLNINRKDLFLPLILNGPK